MEFVNIKSPNNDSNKFGVNNKKSYTDQTATVKLYDIICAYLGLHKIYIFLNFLKSAFSIDGRMFPLNTLQN